MSEKICACLLRLFPSAFRRYYGDEALQMVRDRLCNENGLFPRLRLSLELIADLVEALPQAYRNSYGEAAPDVCTSQFEGSPSFRVLQTEPIRRAAVAIAGTLSLTTVAIFTFLLTRPVPYRAVPNVHISSIESVIGRLNQPISPNSADISSSNAAVGTSAMTGRSEPGSSTGANAVPSHAMSATSQAAQPREQHSSASHFDQEPPVATPSPSAQSQPETIRETARSARSSNVQALGNASAASDLSGVWTGSFQGVGKQADLPQWFTFKQRNLTLTGSGGPDSNEQYSIIHGSVEGNSVKFELKSKKSTLLYDLTLEGKLLQGSLSVTTTSATQTVSVQLQRAQ